MSTPTTGPTIAIVGGGAVGAALFMSVCEKLTADARDPRVKPRVVIVEKAKRVGPGLAYAHDESPYFLNQSAQTMSLVRDDRAHFCEWLAARGEAPRAGEETFSPRRVFGDYVEECFTRTAEKARRRGITVTTIHDEALHLTPRRFGGYRVTTRAHAAIDADVAVLALGNLQSTKRRALDPRGFVPSPYPSAPMRARIVKDARVAIIGTGLSAIDAAFALVAGGHAAPITMVSRSGLLPSVRGPLEPFTLRHVTRAHIAEETDHGRRPLRWSTVLTWLARELADHDRAVDWDRDFPAWIEPRAYYEAQIREAERGPRVWQAIGEALNPLIEILWHHLDARDRQLFLDRFYSRFMSHWVPIPLPTARRVSALLREGRLLVERGLTEVTFDAGASEYQLHLRDTPSSPRAFDVVIDATGVPRHVQDCDSPLLHALLAQGVVTAHEHGGVRVDFESLRVLGKSGEADASLFALGNLTSGTHLFTSTLEQSVEKAERVAGHIVSELQRRSGLDQHVYAPSHSS